MLSKEEILEALDGFTGTSEVHRLSWLSGLVLTDGCYWLAITTNSIWLFDLIESYQSFCSRDPMLVGIQFWKLTVKDDYNSRLICERDSGDVAIDIPITGTPRFPLDEIRIWVENGVCMLPSER